MTGEFHPEMPVTRLGRAACLTLAATLTFSGMSTSRQTPLAGESCGVVKKIADGCKAELQVTGPGQSFSISIPKEVRSAFTNLTAYDAATVCVTAVPSKPGKSFTAKVKDPSEIRIVNPRIAPSSPERIFEPKDPGVSPPKLVRQVPPKYTDDALQAKIQGDVELTAVVLPNGTVGEIGIVRGLDPCRGLDDQAIRAAKQWRFSPALVDGQPAAVRVTLILSFRLH